MENVLNKYFNICIIFLNKNFKNKKFNNLFIKKK